MVGRRPRHEMHLDFLGALQVAFKARLASCHSFVKPGVFNGNGNLRSERGENADVLFA